MFSLSLIGVNMDESEVAMEAGVIMPDWGVIPVNHNTRIKLCYHIYLVHLHIIISGNNIDEYFIYILDNP